MVVIFFIVGFFGSVIVGYFVGVVGLLNNLVLGIIIMSFFFMVFVLKVFGFFGIEGMVVMIFVVVVICIVVVIVGDMM